MATELYRNTTLGNALQDTIEEMLKENRISLDLAYKILKRYDESMTQMLNTRAKANITFKAEKLHTYRFCDTVWTLLLNGVEFREGFDIGRFENVKIVAVAAINNAKDLDKKKKY